VLPTRTPLLATALLVLVAPSAAACSINGDIEGVKVAVRDWGTDETWAVQVEDWGLSGTCDILVPYDLEDDRFAWIDGGNVTVLDLANRTNETYAVEDPVLLSLAGDAAFVLRGDPGRVVRVDLATGNASRADATLDYGDDVVTNEGVFAWTRSAGGEGEVYAYDAVDERWVLDGADATTLGVEAGASPVLAGQGWLGFEDDSLYDVENETVREDASLLRNASDANGFSSEDRWVHVDGDEAWDLTSDDELRRATLPDGEWWSVGRFGNATSPLPEGYLAEESFVSGEDGTSDDDPDGDASDPRPEDGEDRDRSIPAAGLPGSLAALAAGSAAFTALGRRWGRS
jgi:hypothetical protein